MEDKDFDAVFSGLPAQTVAEETIEEPVAPVEPIDVEAEEAPMETDPAETAPAPNEPKMVPLAALQEQRSKTRDYASEIDSLRTQIAQLTAPKPEAAKPQAVALDGPPDPYDNPEGYTAFIQQQIMAHTQQAIARNNLEASRVRAVGKYGKEFVDGVADWAGSYAEQNPGFEAELLSQADPAEWVIEQKRRHDEFAAFTADREAFLRNYAATNGLPTTAPAVVTTTPVKKPNGPASLVHAKSADTAFSKEQDVASFNAIFDRK